MIAQTISKGLAGALRNVGIGMGLIALALSFGAPEAQAAPKAKLWERWQAHDATATARIDHGEWNRVLSVYLKAGEDGLNRVDYAAVTAPDRAALDAYVSGLAATPISTHNRAEQFAYWVNLYNALTVKVILDHYPVESIRDIDISPGLFANGPWGAKLLTIEGEEVSLDDIEHRILRPIWNDPRIHYAVNCAAIGCPNLMPVALNGENTEKNLNEAARAFINHPRGVRFDGDDLVVSKIFTWFEEDFGGNEAAVIQHLQRYAEPELRARLSGLTDIDDYEYDWSLNDA